MTESVLERRPLYGIGTIARLTGVKPDTLRVWERRYGLGASFKSATGRRQYTQGDLEHLQLVSSLVAGGARIGEIAGAGRKTLESLLRQGNRDARNLPELKPKVVFVGQSLCDWLDDHQGCLAGVDALLVRTKADALPDEHLPELVGCDALIVFAPGLSGSAIAAARELQDKLEADRVVLVYEFSSARAEGQAQSEDLTAIAFPPDPARLAFEITRCAAEKLTRQGQDDLGELVQARPREFIAEELSAAMTLSHSLDCECPRHVAQLVESLANFERYSADCSAESWEDAAVHARVYAFAAQARWLMERALRALLEGREAEFTAALEHLRSRDAADQGGRVAEISR